MKNYLTYLAGALVLFSVSGCDVNDQLQQDVPESRLLFANDQLEQDIYVAPTMEEFHYDLYLYRSGVKNESGAQATIHVDESVLTDYNAANNTTYQLLPDDYYTFGDLVSIPEREQVGISEVTILAGRIANELNDDGVYALPFQITQSEGADINSEKDRVVLVINIREPYIRQQTYGLEEGFAIGGANYNESFNIFVDFENEWDIELGYEVDFSLVDSYNETHSTTYLPLPDANIQNLPSSFTLVSGTNSMDVDIELSTDALHYFQPYLLPIKLVSMSEFSIDPDRDIIYLKFVRNFDPANSEIVPLTDEMIETFTQESSEGPKESLVDGNTDTYWHSAWSSGVEPLPHWIQITFPEPTELGGLNYTFRQPSGIDDRPNHFDIQLSDDGEAWNTVWTSIPNLPVEPVDSVQTLIFDQNYSSTLFRIRILGTHSNREWTHLGGIEVFRVTE